MTIDVPALNAQREAFNLANPPGTWAPDDHGDRCIDLTGRKMPKLEPHGANGDGTVRIRRLGKTRAGRTLDGVTHDGLPDFQPGRQTSEAQVRHG